MQRAWIGLLLAACSASAPPLDTLERAHGEGPGPVVVLLHGYGSSPETFLGMNDRTDMPPGTRFVFPRAPHTIEGSDHALMWWPLPRHLADLTHERPEGMDDARARILALLDRVRTAHPHRPLVLGGFSQGAMVSLDVALHTSLPLAGLVLMSGTLFDEHDTLSRLDRLHGVPVYASHGTSDPVLAYAPDARLVQAMRDHGIEVQFETFDGGHVVTPEISNQVTRFIAAAR